MCVSVYFFKLPLSLQQSLSWKTTAGSEKWMWRMKLPSKLCKTKTINNKSWVWLIIRISNACFKMLKQLSQHSFSKSHCWVIFVLRVKVKTMPICLLQPRPKLWQIHCEPVQFHRNFCEVSQNNFDKYGKQKSNDNLI